jgi:phytoene dehydrogenase-like protein
MANKKIAIIGGGIAGLCAGVYAQRSGYDAEIFEMGAEPGGLATSWRRGDYTFETCIHWLLGSNPHGVFHAQWQEVFEIDRLKFIDQDEYIRLETDRGERVSLYSDVDRMESELLRIAPQDAKEIRHLAASVRRLGALPLPDANAPWAAGLLSMMRTVPFMPLLREWSGMSCDQYSRRYSHPLLRSLFAREDELAALAFVFSLAWMSRRNAGYPIGGSRAVIQAIADRFRSLGGRLRVNAEVDRIQVENGAATALELANGETIPADWVISAADGHSTIYHLLGGKYRDGKIDRIYRTLKTFPSYVQVSFGIARDLSGSAPFVIRVLDTPLELDPVTRCDRAAFRLFHYDPTFAPQGKTAVTCFLPTRNFAFWADLRQNDFQRYTAEKQRIAEQVMNILERSVPGVRDALEETDVATPATVIRCTGNWKGSMEGWLITPGMGFRTLPQTLPGLRGFAMAGQWVLPGGGLPSGLMTARSAMQLICKEDHAEFLPPHPVLRSVATTGSRT